MSGFARNLRGQNVADIAVAQIGAGLKAIVVHLGLFFASLGGVGLLLLGILDSSFLFLPLGNDLLIVGLTARNPAHLAYYVLMATAGSVLGCAVHVLGELQRWRRGPGEAEALKPELDYAKKKVKERAAFALALARL